MGIFNKINQRSGLVVGTIVVGLGLFLLGDAFTSNSLFNSFRNKIGEINGSTVTIEEFQKAIVKAEALYGGSGSNVNMEDMAWNQLVFEKVYKTDFEEAGIELSEEEKMDLLEGNNRSEIIKQQFPGDDDLKKFLAYLDSDQIKSEEERENIKSRWRALKEYVFNERLRAKYENVLKKSEYVTKAEGKRFYHTQNDKMEASYVYVPYYSIKDSSIHVSDEMLQNYLDEHKNEFKVEQGRSIEFAIFDNIPSGLDSAYARKDLAKLKEEFKESKNDSSFIRANSDNASDPSVVPISQLPDRLSVMANSLQVDSVYGPFSQNTGYALTKILKIENDTNVVARASHILFRFNPGDSAAQKAEAKLKAQQVLKEIEAGASFERMAAQYGGDGTASKGGDLGWFGKGQMVAPFQNAVFGASKPGVLPNIVETQFGYHIIRIDVPKTGRKYKVATVQKNIEAYQNTIDSIYRIADNFTTVIKDTATFNAEVKKLKGANKFEQANIEGTAKTITGLTDGREIVKWVYNDDREVGDVSYVFTIENKNIVVLVTGMRDKGFASVADVKDQIKPKVIIEEKAKQIKAKLQTTGELPAIAKAYGTDALTGTANDVILSSGMITGVGYEPEASGSLFGLTKGKKTTALTGDNGVLILQCVNFTPSEIADYNQFVTQLLQQRTARMGYGIIDEAIRKSADIEDMRYRF